MLLLLLLPSVQGAARVSAKKRGRPYSSL